MNQIKHNKKNSNWQEATSLLFASVAEDLKLGTTEKKSSKWPERDSNVGRRIGSPTRWPLEHAAHASGLHTDRLMFIYFWFVTLEPGPGS